MNSRLKARLLLIRWRIRHLDRHQLRRWGYKLTRPPSFPYLSGDGFRCVADHVYDETRVHFCARKVHEGQIVFVSTYFARKFFQDVDPRIPVNYKLITHNSDLAVDADLFALRSRKVLMWFAQNCTISHEALIPIPIGLENLHHYNAGIPQDFADLKPLLGERRNRVLSGFAVATNPRDRRVAKDVAAAAPCVEELPEWLGQQEYWRTLMSYKFVLSPPGNGVDAHRTWEAMYLGVVPIVMDSVAMQSFAARGMPIWILRSWDELLTIREPDLERKYRELQDGFDSPALFIDYWRELIHCPGVTDSRSGCRDATHVPAGQEKSR